MTLWLASGSPRRKQLLEWVGYALEVRPADIDERQHAGEEPVAYARRLAAEKAAGAPGSVVVVAADTVVHFDGQILDKPTDRDDARAHLQRLSGRWHQVTTGVCVRRGDDCNTFHVSTGVRFRVLSGAEIDAYVATGEADDKAGAYGIQGRAGVFVAEVRGSWTNVMGLPVEEVVQAIQERA